MSSHRSLYLGSESDPRPIFRQEAPEAHSWPEGAVFAVTFERRRFSRFPWDSHYGAVLSRTEFYGADGWPLEFPSERKVALSDVMKRDFQVFPHDWRTWSDDSWREATNYPEDFPRFRAQTGLASPIVTSLSELADIIE